jgi:DUF1680 family protein
MAIKVNGVAQQAVESNGYLTIDRSWRAEDRIEIALPMKLHTAPLPGGPTIEDMMYGPLVLAGLMGRDGLTTDMLYGKEGPAHSGQFTEAPIPRAAAPNSGPWVTKAGDRLHFDAVVSDQAMPMKPLYQVYDERYTLYFQVDRKA